MIEKSSGLVLALTGLILVFLLALMLIDARGKAGQGPRWWRRVLTAGLAVLGLFVSPALRAQAADVTPAAKSDEKKAEDRRHQILCYSRAPIDKPARTLNRIDKRVSRLEKLAAAGKLDDPVICKLARVLRSELKKFRTIDFKNKNQPEYQTNRLQMKSLKKRILRLRHTKMGQLACVATVIDNSGFRRVDLKPTKWDAWQDKLQQQLKSSESAREMVRKASFDLSDPLKIIAVCTRDPKVAVKQARVLLKRFDAFSKGVKGSKDPDIRRMFEIRDEVQAVTDSIEHNCGMP